MEIRIDGEGPAGLNTWPREELADALRATVMHRNGHLYTAEEPNWDAADAILAGQDPSFHVVGRVRTKSDSRRNHS
jgi:hypothetical protein